jgi:hypothetical protein
MQDKSSFVKVPLVITKQLKLFFNNFSRIPTEVEQPVAEFCIIGESVCSVRQLQAAEVLSKLSTMKDKSSFVKVPLVTTKQLKLFFNNSSRISTEYALKMF